MAIGVSGKLFKWNGNFLIGREHSVVVDKVKSEKRTIRSDVPQGSVLGPLPFRTLISDIEVGLVSAKTSSFADDTKVVMNIKSREDQLLLQAE